MSQWVESGRAEFGVVQLHTTTGSFDEHPLFTEPFVALNTKGKAPARQKTISLASLADEPFTQCKGVRRDD